MKRVRKIAITVLALMISASSVFAFVPRTSPQSTVHSLQCGEKNRSTEYIFDGMNPTFAGSFRLRYSTARQDGVAGRMNRIKYPDSSTASFDYDLSGNMTYASNQNAEVSLE